MTSATTFSHGETGVARTDSPFFHPTLAFLGDRARQTPELPSTCGNPTSATVMSDASFSFLTSQPHASNTVTTATTAVGYTSNATTYEAPQLRLALSEAATATTTIAATTGSITSSTVGGGAAPTGGGGGGGGFSVQHTSSGGNTCVGGGGGRRGTVTASIRSNASPPLPSGSHSRVSSGPWGFARSSPDCHVFARTVNAEETIPTFTLATTAVTAAAATGGGGGGSRLDLAAENGTTGYSARRLPDTLGARTSLATGTVTADPLYATMGSAATVATAMGIDAAATANIPNSAPTQSLPVPMARTRRGVSVADAGPTTTTSATAPTVAAAATFLSGSRSWENSMQALWRPPQPQSETRSCGVKRVDGGGSTIPMPPPAPLPSQGLSSPYLQTIPPTYAPVQQTQASTHGRPGGGCSSLPPPPPPPPLPSILKCTATLRTEGSGVTGSHNTTNHHHIPAQHHHQHHASFGRPPSLSTVTVTLTPPTPRDDEMPAPLGSSPQAQLQQPSLPSPPPLPQQQSHHQPHQPHQHTQSQQQQQQRQPPPPPVAVMPPAPRKGVDRFIGATIGKGRFIIHAKIGNGSFGEIFCGTDRWSNRAVAAKFEPAKVRQPQLLFESRLYKHLHTPTTNYHPSMTRCNLATFVTNNPLIYSGGSPDRGARYSPTMPVHVNSGCGAGGGGGDGGGGSNGHHRSSHHHHGSGRWRAPSPTRGAEHCATSTPGTPILQQPQACIPTPPSAYTLVLPYGSRGAASSGSNAGLSPATGSAFSSALMANDGGTEVLMTTGATTATVGVTSALDACSAVDGQPSRGYPTFLSPASPPEVPRDASRVVITSPPPRPPPLSPVATAATTKHSINNSNTNTPMSGLTTSNHHQHYPQHGGGGGGGGDDIYWANATFANLVEAVGVPRCIYYGLEGDYNVLVMDLLGPNLEDLFNYCNRRFSIKTVCLLADQMLHRLEYLHQKGFIHRDLKPENFVLGNSSGSDGCRNDSGGGAISTPMGHVVHLIDFGLAKRFWDSRLNAHVPFKEGKSLTGTARYCSVSAHLGVEQSRRDDLESLGYILLYFLKRGHLPWQGIRGVGGGCGLDAHAKNMRIAEKKVHTSLETLCQGTPPQMVRYMKYCRALKFEEAPNYSACRELFAQMLEVHGGCSCAETRRDWVFDWVVKRRMERRQEAGTRRQQRGSDTQQHQQHHQHRRGQHHPKQRGEQLRNPPSTPTREPVEFSAVGNGDTDVEVEDGGSTVMGTHGDTCAQVGESDTQTDLGTARDRLETAGGRVRLERVHPR